MNTRKKIDCVLILSIFFISLHAYDVEDTIPSYDFFDDPIANLFVEQTDWNITRDKQDIIDVLEELNVIELLKENFFLHTNALNSRSLLDQPFNLFLSCCYSSCVPERSHRNYGFHLFFNQMTRMVFRHDSTNVDAYLAICQGQFLEKLKAVIEQFKKLKPDFDIDPERATMLFRHLTVQERRAGFMLYGKHQLRGPHEIMIAWKIPFYLLERNYFLTDAQRAALEEEFGTLEGDDQREFEDKHLVATRLGFGDTRITVDIPITRSPGWAFGAGTFVDIPTAITCARGVFRGSRNGLKPKKCCRPLPNLELLLDDEAIENNTAEAAALDFLLDALDHIGSNLLDVPLGNGGHFGIGISMYSKMPLDFIIKRPWAKNFRIRTYYSVQYLFPKRETRYFIECDNPLAFDQRNFNDDSQTDSNFDFLTRTITDRLYPFAFNTTVYPNFIARSSTQLIYRGRKKGFTLGSDSWARTKESLKSIAIPNNCNPPLLQVDKIKARKPFAYQSKLCGSLFFKKNGSANKVWCFSLYVDKTFVSTGIGEDFVLAFQVNCNF